MKVDVYKNLTKDVYSVRSRAWPNRGTVVAHTNSYLVVGVEFAVQPAGRAKVIETRQKNVHAFIRGEGMEIPGEVAQALLDTHKMTQVTYNPYECDSFVERASRVKRKWAEFAVIFDKKVWANNPS